MSQSRRSSSRLAAQAKAPVAETLLPKTPRAETTASPSPTPTNPILFKDVEEFSQWLSHHPPPSGAFLQLSKKTNPVPSLTYDQALDVALAHGWIDGQRKSFPGSPHHFLQRFTPRRKGSMWSKRNVGIIERLTAAGQMRDAGLEEVRKAKEDGRWDKAYEGSSAMTVPDDLIKALKRDKKAWKAWEKLTKAERYGHLLKVETAKDAKQRDQRIESCVTAMSKDGR